MTLPRWDLADLYGDYTNPAIQQDQQTLLNKSQACEATYKGALTNAKAQLWKQFLSDYEDITDLSDKLMGHAYLVHVTNLTDQGVSAFFQGMRETISEAMKCLTFIDIEVKAMTYEYMATLLSDEKLKKYTSWFERMRLFGPHVLSEAAEKFVMDHHLTARSAWVRLFDETMATMVFDYDGQVLGVAEITDKMTDPDGAIREAASRSFSAGLSKHNHLLTFITNTLAKDKALEDNWRSYNKVMDQRNLSNQIEGEVVQTLIDTVKDSYEKLSHRYYKLKAGFLGQDTLKYWDRNAPLGDVTTRYTWDQAKNIVLQAYHEFSPEMADIGQQFFDKNWIDVPPENSKTSGAFSHPLSAGTHPYILLNFQGKIRDVMTLAHELGHGVHQVLSAKQGPLMCDTPLTIAETASVFGEMLTFQSMLSHMENPDDKRLLMCSKIEDMLNTVVRQISFCCFEQKVHETRTQTGKELSSDQLAEFWRNTQQEALGEAVEWDSICDVYWSYIPHFIHSPFYVYAYAFGDCMANSLYAVYQKGQVSDFDKLYINLLSAAGTKPHYELVAPFGLDTRQAAFWQQGLGVIEDLIDQVASD